MPSTTKNSVAKTIVTGHDHFHSRRKQGTTSTVVISIVPETAMPYAPASRFDERNTSTSAIAATARHQFTSGTYTFPSPSSE